MKKLPTLVLSLLVAAGCGGARDLATEPASLSSTLVEIEGPSCSTLYAGQHIEAGSVCVSVDGDDLVVSYETINGWELTYAHLWVGTDLADMPRARNGNPKIGQFPYHSGDITATSYAFRLPLSQWGLSGSTTSCDPLELLLAAHADLRKDNGDGSYQTETGWADGDPLGRSWATYFGVTLVCTDDGPDPDPDPHGCTTSYAFGGASATCFIDADFDGDGNDDGFSRWGWSNGPLSAPGSYSFDIWAQAGQCDLSKGVQVGTLAVEYDGTVAHITYVAAAGFGFTEFHGYVGNEPLPRGNDGQYCIANGASCMHEVKEFAAELSSYSWSAQVSGDIYVVAHAVACGPGLD